MVVCVWSGKSVGMVDSRLLDVPDPILAAYNENVRNDGSARRKSGSNVCGQARKLRP